MRERHVHRASITDAKWISLGYATMSNFDGDLGQFCSGLASRKTAAKEWHEAVGANNAALQTPRVMQQQISDEKRNPLLGF
jgi:hypothetical protein